LYCQRCSSTIIRRAIAPGRKQKLYPEYCTLLANRTSSDINTADSKQLILPGLWFFFLFFFVTVSQLSRSSRHRV
jgi:hypothetical protein